MMSKNIIVTSIIALLFSSACFANIQGTSDTDIVLPEMKSIVLLCDGHEGDANLPTEEN